VATIGAFILAAGVLVFVIDVARNFRIGETKDPNPWGAGTLEFLPQDVYSTRSIPHISSREPLWDDPDLPRAVDAGEHYLPDAPTGGRETIITSPLEATPQYVIQMPGPGWMHVSAAVFTAAFFLLLTVKVVWPAIMCGALAVASCLAWVWNIDKGPRDKPVHIGAGIELPVYVTGPMAHGWWAMIVLMLVAGSLYLAYLFSYLYLWTVSPDAWARGREFLPSLLWPLLSFTGFSGSACLFLAALRTMGTKERPRTITPVLAFLAAVLAFGAVAAELWGHWSAGLRPTQSSYGAMVYMSSVLTGQLVLAVVVMCGFVIARHFAGKLDTVRRASLENTSLLAWYTTAQAAIGLLIVHGFPHVMDAR
jgi:cytochrome c oxidase subunit I+III